jgi:hypothetical protein
MGGHLELKVVMGKIHNHLKGKNGREKEKKNRATPVTMRWQIQIPWLQL